MTDNKTGPEWAPLRMYIKEYKIVLSIYDKDDKLVRTEKLDYGKQEDKVWLGRLSHWAWDQGHSVETMKDES